jgi:hypothetical protein
MNYPRPLPPGIQIRPPSLAGRVLINHDPAFSPQYPAQPATPSLACRGIFICYTVTTRMVIGFHGIFDVLQGIFV